VLYAYDRKQIAAVSLTGDADAIEALQAARLGP
jgi:hypothetical protein